MAPTNYFADISSNNRAFSAAPYASAGHTFVAIKATEDRGYVNPEYEAWVHNAHQHGLSVLHYMFSRPESGFPRQQVEHFWEIIRPHFRRPGDYVVMDVETSNPREAAAWTHEADAHLHSISGTHPWLYTYLSFLTEGELTIASKMIWLAAYSSQRPGTWRWGLPNGQTLAAWQRTDGVNGLTPHGAAGIPGVCDMSVMNPGVAKSIRKSMGKR